MILNQALYVVLLSGVFFLLSKLFPAIKIRSFIAALGVAVVYSVLNYLLSWFIGGVFKTLTIFIFFIAWFFTSFVVNTVIIYLTDKLMDSFEIENFSWTAITAGVITVSSFALHKVLGI